MIFGGETSKELGITTVYARYGAVDKVESEADYVIDAFEEILDLLI